VVNRGATALVVALVTAAIAGPWLAPYAPDVQHRGYLFAPPMTPRIIFEGSLHAPFVHPIVLVDRLTRQYEPDAARTKPLPWFDRSVDEPSFLLGADSFGRDLLSRVLSGSRVSIGLALVSMFLALLIGTAIGGVAGYRGGWIDEIAMRTADLVIVLPIIYVVLVLRAALPLVLAPTTIFVLMAAIFALVGWPFVARGVRAVVLLERERAHVTAAEALGASRWRILRRHLLPACGSYLQAQAVLLLPAFILAEATLSYVGLGFPEHLATWGTMLIDAANLSAMTQFPWTLTPALAIFLVVLSANVILRSNKIRQPSP
jgi:peptide/nickel transport system permease protein